MQTPIPCNLCGSSRQSVVFPAGRAQINQVVRCDDCTLMFASPRVRADIEEIVGWDAEEVYRLTRLRDIDRIEKQSLQRRDYADTKAVLAERHPSRGLLVEVGSSLGYLLDHFRKDGWNVLGVEPNKGWAIYAERELDIRTLPSTLAEASLPEHSVDAVLMMHVIEHVPDPCSVFADVLRVLKPGGTFVLETPRYDSLAFKLLGHRERSVSCEGHIYFFTTSTLTGMAKKCGFEVLRVDYVGRSMTLSRLMYNFGVMSKSKAIARALHRLSNALSLNRLSLHINARDMVRIYLTPA